VSPAPPAADRDALFAEWGFPAHHRLLVSVGRLEPRKNQALAVRAAARIDDVSLALLGDGPMRAALLRLAEEAGLAGRVVAPGRRLDARAIVGASDVFLSTSDWEGLPMVVLEALAGGTPVVATAVRGVREILTDGLDALLVPARDDAALAAAVRRVIDDADLRSRLTAGGARTVAAYSEDAMVDRFAALYGELVA
jgi:glycosyltransferase involved in cell wall biosynthesis